MQAVNQARMTGAQTGLINAQTKVANQQADITAIKAGVMRWIYNQDWHAIGGKAGDMIRGLIRSIDNLGEPMDPYNSDAYIGLLDTIEGIGKAGESSAQSVRDELRLLEESLSDLLRKVRRD